MGIYGQDWSSYQSASPSVDGLDFVFTKITEGLTYTAPSWVTQRDTVKQHGLVWGAYHYPHMANDPVSEADRFLGKVNWQPGDVVVLDWEGYDPANQGVSHSRMLQYRDVWLRHVKSKLPHNPVGMYCNVDYWRNIDTTSNCGDFLWIATGGRPAGDPGISYPWLFHQYSGASTDKNYCHLASRQALKDWTLSFQGTQPKPVPQPQPKPVPQPKPPEVPDMDANQAKQLADIHAAVVDKSITSQVDGTKHSLGEHTAATNAASFATRKDVDEIKATLDKILKALGSLS